MSLSLGLGLALRGAVAGGAVSDPLFDIYEGPMLNGLRLTTESGVPVSSSDRTAQSTLYLTPFISGYIALYVSSAWSAKSTAEVSLALTGLTSGKNYDVFAYWTGSAVALELSTAWTNDTTRATALATQDGIYVKTGDATRRYVGTIRTTSTTTTEDSAAKRFVYNGPEPWRQVSRAMNNPVEGTNSWTYTTATWRQANANTANKVEVLVGLTSNVDAQVVAAGTGSVDAFSSMCGSVGIGIDSTTVNSAQIFQAPYAGSRGSPAQAQYSGRLTAGYHAINWLEIGDVGATSATQTWYGDNGSTMLQSGLAAQVPG